MKKFAYSFIDFDNTIFATSARFAPAIREVFLRAGVTEDDFETTRKATVEGSNGAFYDYSFEAHVAALAAIGYTLSADLINQLNALLEKNSFEMPGATEFLTWVRSVSDKVVMVTAGNHDFQHKKLASTKLGAFFDEVVVVHENKGSVVARYVGMQTGPVLFVNDSARENVAIREQFPKTTIVGVVNPHRPDAHLATKLPYFETLTEVQQYVEQHS